MDASVARRAWQLLEAYHGCVYFAPEARRCYEAVGLRGGWMGYFASRAAPMGAVPAAVVVATFYGFHPDMVRRAIPDAWHLATPASCVEARWRVADAALTRLLGDATPSTSLARAAILAGEAADAADPVGRPLFAGHTTLAEQDEPHLALWRAATLLREHRGDGHVVTLVDAELDGCESHVLLAASTGAVTADEQRRFRGWSDQDWHEAEERLRARGWLGPDGAVSATGREAHAAIERRTDELALAPFRALGEDRSDALLAALRPAVERLVAAGGIPFPNPMGVTRAR